MLRRAGVPVQDCGDLSGDKALNSFRLGPARMYCQHLRSDCRMGKDRLEHLQLCPTRCLSFTGKVEADFADEWCPSKQSIEQTAFQGRRGRGPQRMESERRDDPRAPPQLHHQRLVRARKVCYGDDRHVSGQSSLEDIDRSRVSIEVAVRVYVGGRGQSTASGSRARSARSEVVESHERISSRPRRYTPSNEARSFPGIGPLRTTSVHLVGWLIL
jgi:hypothetical protein